MFGLIFYVMTICVAVGAAVITVISALAELSENKSRLRHLQFILVGVFITITTYYFSDFDVLMGGDGYYGFFYRGLDIVSSWMITVSWMNMMLDEIGVNDIAEIKFWKYARSWLNIIFAAVLFAYVFCVDSNYEILMLQGAVISAQIALTLTILISGALLMIKAAKVNAADSISKTVCSDTACESDSKVIRKFPLLICIGISSNLLNLYNGVMSLLVFKKMYDYDSWIGIYDFNSELHLAVAASVLVMSVNIYREIEAKRKKAAAELTTYKIGEEDEKPEVYDKRTNIANEYGLSGREMEIAALLYQKLSYEMIGEKLFISRYTVKRHVHNIYEKMGVTRRDDFIRMLDGENDG